MKREAGGFLPDLIDEGRQPLGSRRIVAAADCQDQAHDGTALHERRRVEKGADLQRSRREAVDGTGLREQRGGLAVDGVGRGGQTNRRGGEFRRVDPGLGKARQGAADTDAGEARIVVHGIVRRARDRRRRQWRQAAPAGQPGKGRSESDLADIDRRAHGGEAEHPCPPLQAQEEGLGDVVAVVGEKQIRGAGLAAGVDQQAVARPPRRVLDVGVGPRALPGEHPPVHATVPRQRHDAGRLAPRPGAQPVIDRQHEDLGRVARVSLRQRSTQSSSASESAPPETASATRRAEEIGEKRASRSPVASGRAGSAAGGCLGVDDPLFEGIRHLRVILEGDRITLARFVRPAESGLRLAKLE